MYNISFLGCKAPYYRSQIKIIPIKKDPTEKEVSDAIRATESNSLNAGEHGTVYPLGATNVVKICGNCADLEITAMDKMYDNGINNSGVQSAGYAFVTPDGKSYLVSNRLEGQEPDVDKNRFTYKNLCSLLDAILELDKPRSSSFDKEYYTIAMHNDLHSANILITPDKGGIVDMEFLEFVGLLDSLEDFWAGKFNNNFSDIPGYISNLKAFEYRTLYNYLLKIKMRDKKLYKETLYNYLAAKSRYHGKMSEYLEEEYKKSGNEILKELSASHKAHSEVLAEPDENVIEAEKAKIELSGLINSAIWVDTEKYARKISSFGLLHRKAANDNEKIYWDDTVLVLERIIKQLNRGYGISNNDILKNINYSV